MDKKTHTESKRVALSPADRHSPEVRKRIEQLSKQIMERNYALYRRLENK